MRALTGDIGGEESRSRIDNSLPKLTSHKMTDDDRWKVLTSAHGKVRSSDFLITMTGKLEAVTFRAEILKF